MKERGRGGDWAGASARTLSMMMLKTRDRGLNQSVKVILGGEQRGKRDRVVETESEGCWGIPKSTYTAPGGSGHLDWP